MNTVMDLERGELAARFSAKCQHMRAMVDDAVRLPPAQVDRWLEVAADARLPPRLRNPLHEVRRTSYRITIVFARSVRIELVCGLRNQWLGYLMPLARDLPPKRARCQGWIYAYPLREDEIRSMLAAYELFCAEWDQREHSRRNPAPGAEQVGYNFYTAPGRFSVTAGWTRDVLDVPRSWYPFKPGFFNFRREPLPRSLVRGAWRFVAEDPIEADMGGTNG